MMDLERFRTLSPEDKATVLENRRIEIERRQQQLMNEATEFLLVPSIPPRAKSADLPAVPNRDEAVRQLMRSDSSIREVQTADGVVYRR